MFKVVQDIIFEVTGKHGVVMDTDFVKDLHLSSFDITSMVCAFEDRYNVEIPTRDIRKLSTVRDVLEYLAGMGLK